MLDLKRFHIRKKGPWLYFQFGHLAIAVSPRLEVEIGGHASLDGCNFQRKRPGPHGVPPTPPRVI